MTANFVPAADVLAGWTADILTGRPPTLYPVADSGLLARIEIGPGNVALFGGPPGSGKTALVMQLVVDALRLTPTLKALVANVEMPPAALLDRQLARLSGIDLQTIRRRKVTPGLMGRVEIGLAALTGVAGRLAFGRPPFGVENVARSADAFGADLVVLDYIQRFSPPGGRPDKKASVDAVMEAARGFADAGAAVIVVAAVGRQRDAQGKAGYGGLNLASFRESSELEYGADDAFILCREDPDDPEAALLKHVKSRNGEPMDLPLRFTGAVQRFDTDTGRAEPGSLVASVRDAWGHGGAAHDEGGEW